MKWKLKAATAVGAIVAFSWWWPPGYCNDIGRFTLVCQDTGGDMMVVPDRWRPKTEAQRKEARLESVEEGVRRLDSQLNNTGCVGSGPTLKQRVEAIENAPAIDSVPAPDALSERDVRKLIEQELQYHKLLPVPCDGCIILNSDGAYVKPIPVDRVGAP